MLWPFVFMCVMATREPGMVYCLQGSTTSPVRTERACDEAYGGVIEKLSRLAYEEYGPFILKSAKTACSKAE